MSLFAQYRQAILIALSILVCISQGTVTNIYIDSAHTSGIGDGSYSNPYKDFYNILQSRLSSASNTINDSVYLRIAKGTYYMDTTLVCNAIKLFIIGGYPNSTVSFDSSNRNPELNKVIISGDIDTNDTKNSDNTYNIIDTNQQNLMIVSSTYFEINGLSFVGTKNYDNGNGGALSISSYETKVYNCDFISNYSNFAGAAIKSQHGKITVDRCKFVDNKCMLTYDSSKCLDPDMDGGGAIAFRGNDSIIIKNNLFEKCISSSVGGAICTQAITLQSENNKFKSDSSTFFGGAIYASVKFINSINDSFSLNKAGQMGGAILTYTDTLKIIDSDIKNNFAADSGGAIFGFTRKILVKNCSINQNKSYKGGGIFSYTNVIDIDSSVFLDDTAVLGGAIFNGGPGVIRNCFFNNNYASYSGGAFNGGANSDIDSTVSTIKFVNCTMSNNKANGYGGAIFFDTDTLEIINSLFNADSASNGGAIYFNYYTPKNLIARNCKFTNNQAGNGGAAIWSDFSMPNSVISYTLFDSNKSLRHTPVSFGWDGLFVNCQMINNSANEFSLIIGRNGLSTTPNVRFKNCTVANNIIPDSTELILYNDTIQNSIFWNNGAYQISNKDPVSYSIIENWPGDGVMNSSLDPLFVNSGSFPCRLGQLSPAVNRGYNSYIDTSVYKTDLAGKARINNGTVDPGAFEYYDTSFIYPPCLLATVDSFSIPSAGSITVNLDSVMFGSVGYYVSCSNRPVSSLVWSFSGQPDNVQVIFNPLTNTCIVKPSSSYLPGSYFRMLVRVTDPENYDMYSERWATFYVVNPGFEICSIDISQNDTSRIIEGRINVRDNIYPVYVVKERLYLYDPLTGLLDKMQYIDSVSVSEISRSSAMGGNNICGTYGFTINPTSANIHNFSGTWTGKTLYQWATDSSSASTGAQYYRKYHKIRFAVKVTNGMDRVHEQIITVPIDFNGPFTTMNVSSSIKSQIITWTAFDEQIKQLKLYRIPEGPGAAAADTFELSQLQISKRTFISDSLQDSRMYHYVLFAEDIHGNTAESDIRAATLSGKYSIEGQVSGSVDGSIPVTVQLFSVDSSGRSTFIRDTSILVSEYYKFTNVENGEYLVKAISPDPDYYSVLPVEWAFTILRSSINLYDFNIIHSSVINNNAVRVEQIPVSGDLKFTVKTNRLFVDEKPAQIELCWESGDTLADTTKQKQLFPINTYTEIMDTTGTAVWTFYITRADIQDSILSKGDTTFLKNIQYINSKLITRQVPYTTLFREAYWHYPIGEEDETDNSVLFAGQCFNKPQSPYVSTPLASDSSVNLTVRPLNAGNSLRTVIKVQKLDGSPVTEQIFLSSDISIPDSIDSTITRKLDWNYLSGITNSSKGHHFLSGLNTNDTDSVKRICKFSNGEALTGNDSSTISWMVKLPSKAEYCLWLYIEDTVKKNTRVSFILNSDRSYTFSINLRSGDKPGWYGTDRLMLDACEAAEVTLVSPVNDIGFSTFALKKYRKGAKPSVSDYVNAVPSGKYLQSHNCTVSGLLPDNQYCILAFVEDRYGNISDTVIDTVKTRAVFDSSAITIHQDVSDGNLVMTINKGGSDTLWLDSAIFTFDSIEYPVAVHAPVPPGNAADIVLTKELLEDLIPLERFNHHTKYDKLSLVFSADITFTRVQTYEKTVNSQSSCDSVGGVYTENTSTRKHWSWKRFRVERIKTTTRTCSYQISTVYRDTIRSGRIPVRWPDNGSSVVASQEYRNPAAPVLDTTLVTSSTILLSCTNYSEQMAGVLKYSFKPGALCADSTIDSISFGNRFTMNSGWIAGRPSFAGSIKSNVGIWRQNGLNGARHQWLDMYDTADKYTGGEFCPDIGVSIDSSDMAIASSVAYPDGFPYISTGIYLTKSEASSNDTSTLEKFNLWVLPCKVNTMSNSRFFWGVDGVPIVSTIGSAFCNDTAAIDWISGPGVYLDSGKHNIDIFMKDDGVGIAAIALSKDAAPPSFTLDQIEQWGESGFDLEIKTKDLPHGTNITFTSQAIDRYGNKSPQSINKYTTKTTPNEIPRLVIAPATALENGYYPSQYPSFTITTASTVSDSLTILLRLRKTENSGAPLDITIPFSTIEKNVWSAAVDSIAPLPEFPIDDTLLSSRNNYSLYACALRAPSDTGAWTKLQFGIRADSGTAPATVVIDNPYYFVPNLRFLYKKGIQVSPNTIVGDLEILFESDSSTAQTFELVAENVTITTDTMTDTAGFHHSSIASIDCSSAGISSYECDNFDGTCSKEPLFSFKYGNFTIETNPDSMGFQTSGSVMYLTSSKSVIIDDAGGRGRISSDTSSIQPLKINYMGCTDTFYVSSDNFIMKNVLQFGSIHDGFNIRSCNTGFIRNRTDSINSTYSIAAAGSCSSCGPFLNFSVLNPKYLDIEFSADEKLKNPVIVNYSSSVPKYSLQFTTGSADTVVSSELEDISYNGWKLHIGSYELNQNGVKLLDFGVQPPQDLFPADLTGNPEYLNGFSNVMISGITGLNDSALHLSGTGTISDPDLKLMTSGNYQFRNIPSISFGPVDSTRDYQLSFTAGTRLALPTWCEPAVSVYSNDPVTDSIVDTVSLFRILPGGISEFEAHGDFKRTVGRIDGNDSRPGLFIDAVNTVKYAAHDFQIRISPKSNVPIFRLGTGFFDDCDTVKIEKGSIGIFSDLSINTLYGKTNFRKTQGDTNAETVYNITPTKFNLLTLPASGIDLMNSRSGVQILLLAPKLDLAGLGLDKGSDLNSYVDIYNASFDCSKNLRGLSARFKMPDGKNKLSNINSEISKIADIELDEIHLGYTADENGKVDKVEIGAAASLTFGSTFKNIGLDKERLFLDDLTVGYRPGSDNPESNNLTLESLHARAFALPRKIGIGPDNFTDNPARTTDYVEIISGGNGLKVDYVNNSSVSGEKKLVINMSNWVVRLTDSFPVPALRNISFVVDTFEYTKDYEKDRGNITKLGAKVQWEPKDGMLGFENYNLRRTKISLGCESSLDPAINKSSLTGYFKIAFDSVEINGKLYACATGGSYLKVYFDGSIDGKASIQFMDTIPIVPLNSPDPQVFINPGTSGTTVELDFKTGTNSQLLLKLKNVTLQSKDTIVALKKKLDIGVEYLECGIENKKPVLKSLAVKTNMNDTLINNSTFSVITDTLKVGYSESGYDGITGKVFWIEAGVKFNCNILTTVNTECKPSLGAIVRVDTGSPQFDFTWKVPCELKGELAGFTFGAKLKISSDTIGFDSGFVEMNVLKDAEILSKDDSNNPNNPEGNIGVAINNLYYVKSGSSWNWINNDGDHIKPTFSIGKGFDILGVRVYGKLDLSRLFNSKPGIAIDNIGIGLKGKEPTYNTGFSLIIDGNKPYVHPEWSKPQKLVIKIPSINLGSLKLGSALMEFGTERDTMYHYESWYFRGQASMSIGVVDPLEVDVAFEKPHPWQNVTGIRHAKVTVKLKSASRIPIGSTPFYISGFFGAMYDGLGMPEGAISCGIKDLPPGLKIEAAIFLEFERPEVVNGRLGFWVHLRSINFGLNGEVKALKGVVDADVCMALYNSGKAFHGHFIVTAELALALQGRFVIDIWSDETGGNFTADAGAKVGLNRGSILNKRWLKLPTRTLWFLDLFTNMGKFDNEQNGVTTGVKIIGKTFGIGVVGGKFCVGNLGKYKLKPSPVAARTTRSLRMASALSAGVESGFALSGSALSTEYDTSRLGLVNLQGGEIISIVAASDTSVLWGNDALKFAYYNGSSWVTDNDGGHYLSEEHSGDESKTESDYNENLNTISRMWYNKRERKLDSLAILLPKQNPGNENYEFMVFASLIPPVSELHADTFTDLSDKKIVKFNGTVKNYQGTIRSIVKDTSISGTQPDTILKQMMRLNFYYAQAVPVIDTSSGTKQKQFLYGYKRIPIEQFTGYTPGDTSLLQNDSVEYSDVTRKLTVRNLQWNTANADSGVYRFFSAVELLDFVTEDENGVKSIIPDSSIDSAMCVRENPLALTEIARPDSLAIVTVTRETAPLCKPQGFSATGSVLTSGTEGTDERRDIYLRWKQEFNSSLAGYEIEIWPQSDISAKRTFTIGPVNRYSITIPVLDSFYTADCDSAGGDSTDVARMCGDAVTDKAYYQDSVFNVVITPFAYRDTVIYEDMSDTSDFYVNDTSGMGKFSDNGKSLRIETKRKIVDLTMSDTATVMLGKNSGNSQNDLQIKFYEGNTAIGSGDTVDVALNDVRVVKTKVIVTNRSTALAASSDYAESYSVVKGYNNAPLSDTMALRLPSSGISGQWFDLTSDTISKVLTFSPSPRDYLCREMFTFPCTTGTVNCGCHENTCDSASENCDPNKAYNERPKMDPCNGNGDALVKGRSPFGVYKVNVYAINNGRRSNPVFNSTAGPSIYDSLHFRIITPEPKLHGMYPDYIRHSDTVSYNDTLHIRASDLWIDTNSLTDTFYVRLTWNNNTDSLILPAVSLQRIVVDKTNRNASVKDVTSADYELLVQAPDSLSNAGDGEKISVQIVNKENGSPSYSNVSNTMYVTYLKQFTNLECSDSYNSDSVNAEFAMNFIGAFNSRPGVDTSDSDNNDTVTAYFTRIYDFDPARYTISLEQGTNTFIVSNFTVEDYGLKFRLPSGIMPGDTILYKIQYINSSSPCYGKTWTAKSVPRIKASFEIVNVYRGCYLAVLGGDASRSNIRYTLGINADAWPYGISNAYRLFPSADTVKISKSTFVTFIITDPDNGNTQRLTKWVDAGDAVKLTDKIYNVLPFEFTVRTGDTLRFKIPGNGTHEAFQPVLTYTWSFADGIEHSEDHIVITAKDSCPLTVQTLYVTPDTSGNMVRIKGPVMVYCPTVLVPVDPVAVRIPSTSILDAMSRTAYGYPLLVRLDSSIVEWSRISDGRLYFTNKYFIPLAHEIESIDSVRKTVNCWVRMDTINALVPDNMLYLVTGDTGTKNSGEVWDRFISVYHCTNDTILTDATGRHSINSSGVTSGIDGVAGSGHTFTGAVNIAPVDELSVNNTGVSLCAWIKIDSSGTIPPDGSPLIKGTDSNGLTVLCLAVMPDLSIMFIAGDDTLRSVNNAVERNVWLQTGASYGWFNTDGIGKLFVNGVAATSGLMNKGNAIAYKKPLTMSIGGVGAGRFCGKLDEIRIAANKIPDSWFALDFSAQRRLNDFLKYRSYTSAITSISDSRCELSGDSRVGSRIYTNSNVYALYDLPAAWRNMVMLKQPVNNLKNDRDTLFNVTVNGPAAITVLADTTCAVPAFLSTWRNTGAVAVVSDSSRGIYTSFAMYEKVLDSAGVVSFENYTTDACRTGSLPYIVLFDLYSSKSNVSAFVNSDLPLKVYNTAADGELLFFDRETVIDSMPPAFNNGMMISSPNVFKSDTSDAFMRVTLVNRSRLHVIADSLSLPEFLNSGWQKESSIYIGNSSSFAVYGKSVPEGFIALGGPSRNKVSSANSSYSLVITKENYQCLIENVEPSQYEVVCDGIDTGSVIYTDTNITVSAISEALRNITYIRTLLSDADRNDSVKMSFKLNKNAWIYCALDSMQAVLPSFMNEDDGDGVWKYTGFTIRNSDGGSYNVWKKFIRSGTHKFSAARSGGETANRYNYLFFASRYNEPDTVDTTMVYPFTVGTKPFSGITTISVSRISDEIDSLTCKRLDAQKTECDTVKMKYSYPVKVYLGVASYISADGTFIETDNWQSTSYTIGFNRLISDYKVFEKEFAANETISIPQIGCFGYNPSAFNHVILIQKLEYPVKGYRTSELSVNSIGNERRAQSDNYKIRNVDIVYSYGLRMNSTSYQMSFVMTGGTRRMSDTTRILSPFIDTVVTTSGTMNVQQGLSKSLSRNTVTISTAAQLPDLIPVLVNADSVTVNAIDLRAEGAVKVIFNNKSDIEIKNAFTVVLYEDNDDNYQYNSSIDKYLGKATVNSIASREYAVYYITLTDKVTFPNRTMFAFIDADRWVSESNERNNTIADKGVCREYELKDYIAEKSVMESFNEDGISRLPDFTDTIIGCYLYDNNKDSVTDNNDSLCIIYSWQYRIHCIKALTGDSLFNSVPVKSEHVRKVSVADINGDNVPEIIAGDLVYSNKGVLITDYSSKLSVQKSGRNAFFDFDRDNVKDSTCAAGEFVTIWSGKDSSLLYVNPKSQWTGILNAATAGVIADIAKGTTNCFNINVSYPRLTREGASDTSEIAIRIGNAGNTAISGGVLVNIYADTNSIASGNIMPSNVTALAEVKTAAVAAGRYEDVKADLIINTNVKRLWFRADRYDRYVECNESDNLLKFDVR